MAFRDQLTATFLRSGPQGFGPAPGSAALFVLLYVGWRTVRLACKAYNRPIDSWHQGRSIQFRLGQNLPATSLSFRRKTPNAGSPMQRTGIHTRRGFHLVVMKNLHKGSHHE